MGLSDLRVLRDPLWGGLSGPEAVGMDVYFVTAPSDSNRDLFASISLKVSKRNLLERTLLKKL